MGTFYIPYNGEAPATIDRKGHKLVLVAQNAKDAEDVIRLIGASSFRAIEVDEEEDESITPLAEESVSKVKPFQDVPDITFRSLGQSSGLNRFFTDLAVTSGGGVVVLPDGEEIDELIDQVLSFLPWVH